MLARVGKWVLYSCFFISALVFWLYITFPINAVKGLIVRELESLLQRGDPGTWVTKPKVDVGRLDLWRISGIRMNKVLILPGSDSANATAWEADSIKVRMGILGAFVEGPNIVFDISAYGGDVEGEVALSKDYKVNDMWARLRGLNMGRMPIFASQGDLPILGALTVDTDIHLGRGLHDNGEGKVDLSFANLGIGPGKLDLGDSGMTGGLTIPKINLGNMHVAMQITQGKGKTSEFKITDGDMQSEAELEIAFNKTFMSSKLNGKGWINISNEFMQANPLIQTMLELQGGAANLRDAQGRIPFKISGSLKNPKPALGKS